MKVDVPASVLLVEDEPLLRSIICEMLEDWGYHVTEAECEDTAWQRVSQGETFDVLLTDVRMPGELDGIALAHKVYSSGSAKHIVVMSAYSNVSLDENMGKFLSKPFSPHKLTAAIRG